MFFTKTRAYELASLLEQKGISDIVISPGSRNGPLVHTFTSNDFFDCRLIVDERSAGYFALGIIQAKQKPVVIVCSSGTATLNYAPAIAEAFYQEKPLIVITADRPEYVINQLENQCLNQKNIYNNHTKKSISLPLEDNEQNSLFAIRELNEILNCATSGQQAPVHINIPFEEPLHQLSTKTPPPVKNITLAEIEMSLSTTEKENLLNVVKASKKIVILVGQNDSDEEFNTTLTAFANKTNAVVLAEHLANITHSSALRQIDVVVSNILEHSPHNFQPDLLITCGRQVVSKNIKTFLKKYKAKVHYHIGENTTHIDTYDILHKLFIMPATQFFQQATQVCENIGISTEYIDKWHTRYTTMCDVYQDYLTACPFSDMRVYGEIFKHIPEHSIIHLANSSPVRYGLLNPVVKHSLYFGNRGVSGIDGSLSTAIGYASTSEKTNTIITGDLSFLYDSNALYNNYVKNNVVIIVINNGGGNIFGLLETLEQSSAFKKYFFAEHTITAQYFAKTFNMEYLCATNLNDTQNALQTIYTEKQTKPMLLEIFTQANDNTQIYKKLHLTLQTVKEQL